MKQITINGRSILLVEVPGKLKSDDFLIMSNKYGWQQFVFPIPLDERYRQWTHGFLPYPGNWQILFKDPLRPTEEEAAGVVEKDGYGFKNYLTPERILIFGKNSWNSLVTSHGFTPGKVVGMIDRG